MEELAKLAPKSAPAATRPVKLTDAADSKNVKATPDKAQHASQLPWQAGSVSGSVTSEIQPAEDQVFSDANEPAQHKAASSHQGTKWVSQACSEMAIKAHDFWHGQVSLCEAWHAEQG